MILFKQLRVERHWCVWLEKRKKCLFESGVYSGDLYLSKKVNKIGLLTLQQYSVTMVTGQLEELSLLLMSLSNEIIENQTLHHILPSGTRVSIRSDYWVGDPAYLWDHYQTCNKALQKIQQGHDPTITTYVKRKLNALLKDYDTFLYLMGQIVYEK